jgi:23S rRNA (guanosine2251-2'-O)-methyltransferase
MEIEKLIEKIKSENLIILEGSISVLSAVYSDYSEITEIILNAEKDTRKIIRAAALNNINTEELPPGKFSELEAGAKLGRTHGGVIALAKKRRFLTPLGLITQADTIAVIEGIEDPYNLGYAVRALYTQGIGGLIIPERDFGLSEAIIEKASTGTFYKMPAAVFSDKPELINLLKNNNFRLYCVDKKAPAGSKAEARDIFQVKFAEKTVFIIGGEKRGISKDFLNSADEIVRIPYANPFAYSLAAQTAATIISYEIHRQRNKRMDFTL